MPPGEVALIFAFVAFGIAGLTAAVNRIDRKWKNRRTRQKGEANKEASAEEAKLVCCMCGKRVDPERGDLLDKELWWHKTCWRSVIE
jgi:hypothetical protein